MLIFQMSDAYLCVFGRYMDSLVPETILKMLKNYSSSEDEIINFSKENLFIKLIKRAKFILL